MHGIWIVVAVIAVFIIAAIWIIKKDTNKPVIGGGHPDEKPDKGDNEKPGEGDSDK